MALPQLLQSPGNPSSTTTARGNSAVAGGKKNTAAVGGLLSSLFKGPTTASPSYQAPTPGSIPGSNIPRAGVQSLAPSSGGIRADAPVATQPPKSTLTASQKAPADKQAIKSSPVVTNTPQNTAATSPSPSYAPGGHALIPGGEPGNVDPGFTGSPGMFGNTKPDTGFQYPAFNGGVGSQAVTGVGNVPPPNPSAQGGTTPSGAVVDANGNMTSGPAGGTGGPTFGGLIGQLISQGGSYQPQIDKTSQNIAQLRQQAATGEAGYLSGGLTLPVAQGRAQVLANTEGTLESALQGQLTNQLKGQELSQGALGTAIGVAQPQLGQYGQTYYNPLQGGQPGAQGGDFAGSMETYAQGAANSSINPSQLPSSITSNPVLFAQVLQRAQQINPNFNATQWQANTQAQQAALQQNVQQGYSIQNSTNSANQALGLLDNFYNQLSPLQTQGIPTTNDIAQSIGQFFGSGAVSQFNTALTDARNQVLSVLTSTGMTATDAQAAVQKFLPNGMTPSQLKANTSAIQQLMQQRVSSFTQPSGAPQYGGGNTSGSTGNTSGGGGIYDF